MTLEMPPEASRRHKPFLNGKGPIRLHGMLVPVTVRLHPDQAKAQRDAGQPIGDKERNIFALIDTGATGTCICNSIAEDLGLRKIDETLVKGATHKRICPVFMAELVLGTQLKFHWIVIGLPPDQMPQKCLLGRDVLEKFTLIYVGPRERYLLYEGAPPNVLQILPDSPPIQTAPESDNGERGTN